MKKLMIVLASLFLFAGVAFAECTVTVTWTPSTSADLASQSVMYDSNNQQAGGEVVQGSNLPKTQNQFTFTIATPLPYDEVWIRSSDANQNFADSAHVIVGGINAATGVTVTVTCGN